MPSSCPTPGSPLVVDFSGAELTELSSFRLLEDRALIAHYYNDRGYDLIRESRKKGIAPPWERILTYFEIATAIDPEFSQAWNNLGVALARLEKWSEAEEAYARSPRPSPLLSQFSRDSKSAQSGHPKKALGTASGGQPLGINHKVERAYLSRVERT